MSVVMEPATGASRTQALCRWIADTDRLRATHHPVSHRDGAHEWDSPYVETFWLPTIGPSALLIFRRLNQRLHGRLAITIDLNDLAGEMGLHGVAANSPVVRTLARLIRFGFADVAHGELRVRSTVLSLPYSRIVDLPADLGARHEAEAGR